MTADIGETFYNHPHRACYSILPMGRFRAYPWLSVGPMQVVEG